MVDQILLTCEHGGNEVPPEYEHLFLDAEHILETHRGYDIGILPFAQAFSERLGAPLYSATVTRLLVELNRSLESPQLFSRFSRVLDSGEREQLLERYYFPHRRLVESVVEEMVQRGPLLHVTVHSFTPLWKGEERRGDITFLYDYRRQAEKELCQKWQSRLAHRTGCVVRRNYPYKGHTDGLTTHLRKSYSERQYVGVTLELNQKYLWDGFPMDWPAHLSQSLRASLDALSPSR